jgi:hypothetical protein
LGEFSPVGRLFCIGQFFNDRSKPNFLATYFRSNSLCIDFGKRGWDTFRAIISQINLVTLLSSCKQTCIRGIL